MCLGDFVSLCDWFHNGKWTPHNVEKKTLLAKDVVVVVAAAAAAAVVVLFCLFVLFCIG